MNRHDLSLKLVHLLKGENIKSNLKTLLGILGEEKFLGGSGHIKGNFKCVCVSEAPLSAIGSIFDNRDAYGFRYQPFGLILDKEWFFEAGGRPVIYQPENEYYFLPDSLKYRHVTFDPTRKPTPIDFTWEREWRLCTDELKIDTTRVSVILPRRSWIHKINKLLKKKNIDRGWTFVALDDLGFNIKLPNLT